MLLLLHLNKFFDKLAKQYTQLDDYALGARVGQCVVIAAQFTKDINSYIEVAEQLFHEMCRSEEELKNASSNVQDKKENKVKTEKQDKPNNLNVITPNVATPVPDTFDEQGIDWDDSIPF